MIGKTIGHYQVVEKLGEGGMGVVYKARDTHLDRFVALKVLPPGKLADAERKRRFIQEAKAASALNHPNIIHIYDIAEQDGVLFIAMEYVAGKPLDQLLDRKALPLKEALRYAVQAADALAKAHSAGIVHRDLKPSNFMVTEEGLVKLLDFGLAKLTEQQNAESGETLTALGSPRTQEGQIVGTVAYMSPEQAEGKKVDSRSDIFSFGAVLYEMVTGQRAFQGGSHVATLAAVLREEPKSASEMTKRLPPELDRVIARCLRKDAERRWQTMSDLRAALHDLKEESESSVLPARSGSPPSRSVVWWLAGALAVAMLALLGVTAWFLLRPRPAPAAPVTWKAVPLTSYPGRELAPSLSPDGSQVAFLWDGEDQKLHLYIKLVGPGRPIRLTGQSGDSRPAWSPDGRSIAFYRRLGPERLALILIPALGGVQRTLAEFDVHVYPNYSPQPAWFPDGKSLLISLRPAGEDRNSLYRCSADTGELTRLTQAPPEALHGDDLPSVAPDGHALAFIRLGIFTFYHLYVLPLPPDGKPAGAPRKLDTGNVPVAHITWTADSRDLVFSTVGLRSNLLRVPTEGSGKPVPMGLSDASQPSISLRGNRLVYAEIRADTNIWALDLKEADRIAGPAHALVASSQREVNPHYSPDGKKIAFSTNRSGNYEIWVADADGENANQLTFLGAPTTGAPRWSPDGRTVAFDSNLAGSYNIYLVGLDGGKARALTKGATNIVPAWTPDGSRIYFGSNRTGRMEIWSMDPSGGSLQQVTRNGGLAPVVSADGQSVFYARGEGDRTTVFKIPAAGGAEQTVVEAVHRSNFSVGPRGIYYCPAGQTALRYLDFKSGKTTELFTSDDPVDLGLALSPNGRRILFAKRDNLNSDLMLVEDFK